MPSSTFDTVWERRYRADRNYRSSYPWTAVVSFVLGCAPKDRLRSEIGVLEIGCGTGNNIWFVANEGFQAAGVDASATAIECARERCARDKVNACLEVADFTKTLPFADASFDLVFERAALSFTTREGAAACVAEVRRVLRPDGLFQCGPYSDRDSSFYRSPDEDGTVRDITVGTIVGGSQARFYSLQNIRDLFRNGWTLQSMKHIEEMEMLRPERESHCEWLVIARKISGAAL
jgi:SAM-dependent methyltransferase